MRQANKIYTNPQLKLFCEGGEGRVYFKKKKNCKEWKKPN